MKVNRTGTIKTEGKTREGNINGFCIIYCVFKVTEKWVRITSERNTGLSTKYCIVLYCGRVPAANAPGCTAAEGLLYKPWSLVFPT